MTDRPFTLGGGIGFGGAQLEGRARQTSADNAMAYTLRLGFGLRPGLMLLWDVEGAFVNRNGTGMSQTANLAALQIFATQSAVPEGRHSVSRQVVTPTTPGRATPPTGAARRWAASGTS